MRFINSIIIIAISICLYSCQPHNENSDNQELDINSIENSTTEIDVIYDSVIINKSVWMKYNLEVATFRNGDSIPLSSTPEEWMKFCDERKPSRYIVTMSVDRYCELMKLPIDNMNNYQTLCFVLYNYYAIIDSRNIAPTGWKIPSKNDWRSLLKHVKSEKYLLEENWVSQSFGNPYGFSLRPSPMGIRKGDYGYDLFSSFSFYWTSSDIVIELLTSYTGDDDFDINLGNNRWREVLTYDALPIRCIK